MISQTIDPMTMQTECELAATQTGIPMSRQK